MNRYRLFSNQKKSDASLILPLSQTHLLFAQPAELNSIHRQAQLLFQRYFGAVLGSPVLATSWKAATALAILKQLEQCDNASKTAAIMMDIAIAMQKSFDEQNAHLRILRPSAFAQLLEKIAANVMFAHSMHQDIHEKIGCAWKTLDGAIERYHGELNQLIKDKALLKRTTNNTLLSLEHGRCSHYDPTFNETTLAKLTDQIQTTTLHLKHAKDVCTQFEILVTKRNLSAHRQGRV